MKTRSALILIVLAGTVLTSTASADIFSIGSGGIRSAGLTRFGGGALNGGGIHIGQVEGGRPGVPAGAAVAADVNGEWWEDSNGNGVYNAGELYLDLDNSGTYTAGYVNSNQFVSPTSVWTQTAAAPRTAILHPGYFPGQAFNMADHNLDSHAQGVASTMISTGGFTTGVSNAARLHSGAYVTTGATVARVEDVLLTIQNVARQNGGDVRAINNSWAKPTPGGTAFNGTSQLSLGVDHITANEGSLMVFAGPQDTRLGWHPQDNYNGLVVGNAESVGGVFQRGHEPAASFAQQPQVGRRVVDLLAPGTGIETATFNGGITAQTGTSFAAPHATGTVALLQEYGDERISAGAARWDADARDPRVMRAVIVNSADKLNGVHGSTRTVTNASGTTSWANTAARADTFQPLDREIGAGMLNAERAVMQLATGEYDSFGTATVPTKGWDMGVTVGAGDINKYVLDTKLAGESYVAITLAWNRNVALNDGNNNGMFDRGETFTGSILNDLDIFLQPKGATTFAEAVMSSRSVVDSIEHIFWQVPAGGGDYEIWVRQFDAPTAGATFYGLAWWANAVPTPGTGVLVMLAGVLAGRRRRA